MPEWIFFVVLCSKNPYDKRHKENRRKDKMKDKKGWSVFLLAVFFLNACGVSKKADVSPVKKETISWTVMLHTAAPPSGTIEEELEKYTGVNIHFNWIPDSAKNERMSAAMASNSLTDIVTLANFKNTAIQSALSTGVFWDVEPYLADYPNLAKLTRNQLDRVRMNGKVYGVPIQNQMARYGVIVRKDWLDHLGLSVPKTIDELAKVAQAFTEDDPDGNGQNDTVGIVDRNESFHVGFRSLTGYFGAGNEFVVTKEGTLLPTFMQVEYQTALKWYREMYQKGWVNQDFVVTSKEEQREMLIQGRGGIMFTSLQDVRYFAEDDVLDPEKKREWVLLNDLTHADIPRRVLSDTNGGLSGLLAIPKSKVPTESELSVVLQFINDLMDEEPFTLMTQGIAGTHYLINEKQEYEKIDQVTWQQEVQPYAASRPNALVKTFKSTEKLINEANQRIAENEPYAILDPTQTLHSETYNTQWAQLIEGISTAYYEYMLGKISMADFDQAIETFKQNDGQKIIDEFTQSYQANQ